MIIKDALKISLGILLVIVGLLGGLIPIFQGWMFGLPGLMILANYFPPAKRLLNWAKKKAGVNKNDDIN
ncbi:MAG: PGPGW domain-containing protein [Candidatus Marinimicrobia bacterium]|nr:PGPGW domain-containing protein [Candidatus Neomarinimicrobiota bacterium]